MPSRTRKRNAEEQAVEIGSSPAPRRTKRARTASEFEVEPVDADGGSSATLVGDSPPGSSKKKRDKGKVRAVSPIAENGAEDARIILGQRALLGRLAHSFSCGICISLFDNPVSLVCGHIFCRGCLEKCFRRELGEQADDGVVLVLGSGDDEIRPFVGPSSPRGPANLSPEDKRRNLVCPVCRARIHDAPMPLFVFREATDAMRRAEADGLLPPDAERRAESPASAIKGYDVARRARQDADSSWGGLFASGGKEKRKRRDVFDRGINDREDGVYRCWDCNWEIEDGQCNGCGRVYDEYELARDTDEESHFSNLPNVVDESSDEESNDGRQRQFESVRVDIDMPGTDDFDEDAEDSDDREFIVGSDEEEVIEAGSTSDGFLDDVEPSRPRRRVFIVSSDDEAGSARAVEHSTAEDSDTQSESGNVQVDGDDVPVILSSDEDEAQPEHSGDPSTLFSPPAVADDSEEETSLDQRRRLREEKRARKAARRERRRQRAEAAATDDAGADSDVEEVQEPAEPVRRRRQISDPSPPRRTRLRIHESDDD